MELEKWTADLRPRRSWEAIDFGFELARDHYLQLLATSAILVLPVAGILALIFHSHLAWLTLALWWVKPAWERAHLFVLSRSLFGARPTIRETLRAFPDYGRRDLLAWLTIRRFSPSRSFDLPVTMLEGSTGMQRSLRLGVLHRGSFTGAAGWLTILGAHVEFALFLAVLLTIELLTPESVDPGAFDWTFGLTGDESPAEADRTTDVLAYLASVGTWLLVAPYYVAGGFSLYLHRRTVLEGWDLELAFRKLARRANRTRPPRAPHASATLLALLGLLTIATAALPARAQTLTPESARESIEEILAGDAFHSVETIHVPRFLLDLELDEEEEPERALPEWLLALIEALAGSLEIILVTTGLAIVGWLAFKTFMRAEDAEHVQTRRARARGAAPTELFGLRITDESLPTDPARAAIALVESGEIRSALALLYRGALTRLGSIYGAEFSQSVTEHECLDTARPVLPDGGRAYFEALTSTWLRCAYGHREPATDRLEALCVEWTEWFELASGSAAAEARPDVD